MIYLASPYTHPDASVREDRFQAACQMTARMMRGGLMVLSPIVHSHPLTAHGLPGDWNYWQQIDRHYLEMCERVTVLMLPGWKESRGVQQEIEIAKELGKPVSYILPEGGRG